MKCFNLFTLFIILYIGICYTLSCEEAKDILNIEYEGNCCDLQQINCDESNENILSIESLLDYDDTNNERSLYRRKGGGHGGGGHGSGGHGGGSHSSGSGSHSSGYFGGGGHSSSGGNTFKPSLFLLIITFILLIKLI